MNIVKKVVLLLVLLAVIPFKAQAQDPYVKHYFPVGSGTNPISATIVVFIDGVQQERPDLELGAFTGDICRGCSFFQMPPSVFPQHYWAGPVISGFDGDIVTFRLYDHTAGKELELNCITTISFHEGDNYGDIFDPFIVYFETSGQTKCFKLVSDAGMLVPGRQFVIGNACDGSGKLMGCQDAENEVRAAVDAVFANQKTEQGIAFNPTVVDMPYQFTLNENGDAWTLFDDVNGSGLSVNVSGNILLGGAPANWDIEVAPSGSVRISTVVEGNTYYLYYDEVKDSFYCSQTENTLFLFAQCEVISGIMDELTVTDAAKMYVVESGSVLEIGSLSTVNPSNLIIEDGAQLICSSPDVQVNVQKNILAYADAMEKNGWYTIASPVTGEIASSSNLLSPDFDLFFFRETVVTKEWRNYKNPENNFTGFESGRGYLYANSNDLCVNLKGTLNTETATYAMTYTDSRPDDLKGFALIGNPYAHNIKKGSDGAIDDARLATGYYTLTHSGIWETHTDDDLIAPCQGILIQTSVAGDLTINGVAASSSRGAKAEGRLAIAVEGEQGCDKAFVYFNEGIGLNKIAHFGDAPMLYLRQNAKNYAIAHYAADETVGEIPVFFQSSENGKYTISVANNGIEFDYLHLVDNLTGEDLDLMVASANSANCIFTAKPSDYAARFKLVYQLHHDDETSAGNFCYFADGRLVIPFIEGESALQIIDMTGHIVSNHSVKGSCNQPLNLSTGVYVVRMGDRMQKIVVF